MAGSDLQPFLINASRTGIVSQVGRLKAAYLNGYIIGPDNPMSAGAVAYLSDPPTPGRVTIRHRADFVGEYIAASSFMHCYDAFSYLSTAWSRLLVGDPSTGIHAAYYSELRSAMSILACDGIGVFNKRHHCVELNGYGSEIPFDVNTHKFCWAAFEWWAFSNGAQSVLNLLDVGGAQASTWLASFPYGGAPIATVGVYLSQIGIDIKQLSNHDQSARGRASYRPRAIEGYEARTPQDDLDLVGQLGEHLVGSNGFRDSSLSVLILCALFRQAFRSSIGEPIDHTSEWNEGIDAVIADMRPVPQIVRLIRRYSAIPFVDIPILSNAINLQDGEVEGVFARSALLCYHATLYARSLLSQCAVAEADLHFWWRPVLESCGAINAGFQATSRDVSQDALDAIDEFLNIAPEPDRKSLWEVHSSALVEACRCERLVVSGLFA